MAARRVFVDTSALHALLVENDARHVDAKRLFAALETERPTLVTSSFVVVETVSLLHARLGTNAVREFEEGIAPILEVVWVGETIYRRAIAALLAARSRRVSVTDWGSFEIMRAEGIESVFAFDRHFGAQGFRLVRGR